MANAAITQSAFEFVTLSQPNAVVAQSVIEFVVGPVIPPIPPQMPGSPNVITGGTPNGVPPPVPVGCIHPNQYNDCLTKIEAAWMRMKFPPAFNMPCELKSCLPWEEEPQILPPQAKPFHQVGSVVTPGAVDTVVTSFRVPTGYDGILLGIFQQYTGTGFVNGSGDILFRIQVNQRYVKDFGANPFHLGNTRFPFPMTEGQLLVSGQKISYVVNVPNLSGNIQVGSSQIVCGLIGFWWPR